jgi:hypothetical protein
MSMEAKNNLRRDVMGLLVSAATGTVRTRLLPDMKNADGELQHLLEFSSNDLNPVVLYIDRGTMLVAKASYAGSRPGQPLVEERFSDYRPVDGVQIAFVAERRVGSLTVTRRVTGITFNTPLDPALFKRPGS